MRLVLAILVGFALSGCSGYLSQTADVRKAYEASDYDKALSLLDKEQKDVRDRDRLLFLLDKGMVQHAAGKFDQSIQTLTEADRLSQQLDVVSLSQEASTLLTNEAERAYKGEDFEKLMISVLQALNYGSLGKDEDALVEVRRVNERIQKMITDEKKPYEQLAVARYISGTLYEDQRDWDNAFIDYEAAYKLQPDLGGLSSAFTRVAKLAGRTDTYDELKKKYPEADDSPLSPKEGEVLVVIEAGLSPQKQSKKEKQPDRYDSTGKLVNGDLLDIPYYEDRWTHAPASVTALNVNHNAVVITNLASVSKVHLNDRVGRMLLKGLAATAVKAGIAAGAGAVTKSEGVGLLTFILLNLTTHADTRSWLSLPAEFQLARVKLPEGKQQISVNYRGQSTPYDVTVKPGRVSLLVVRRY
ncbi:MAG: COG3014 family protein [Myxococcaceae bacterium]